MHSRVGKEKEAMGRSCLIPLIPNFFMSLTLDIREYPGVAKEGGLVSDGAFSPATEETDKCG